MTKLVCTYASNYNGFSIEGMDESDPRVDAVIDDVTCFAVGFCNSDGEFEGNIDDVKATCIESVSQHFGGDFEVEFKEDSFSS